MKNTLSLNLPKSGGLIDPTESSKDSRFNFSPKFLVLFSIAFVVFIWVLFKLNN